MSSFEYTNTFINLTIGMCFVFYRRMGSVYRLSNFHLLKTDSLLWRVRSTALDAALSTTSAWTCLTELSGSLVCNSLWNYGRQVFKF